MAVSATINTAPTISSGTATVYPQSNWPYGTAIAGAPVGSSVTTGSVGTDGSVTFSGLTASTLYVAYQASPDRYVRFRSPAAAATTASSVLGVWQPSHNGLKAATGDPQDSSAAIGLAGGYPSFRRMALEDPTAISSLVISCGNTGSGLTAGQCFAGIYSSAGVLLGKTADLSSGVFDSTGLKTLAFIAESGQSLPSGAAGTWVHVAILLNGTTMPQLHGVANAPGLNAGLGTLTTNGRSAHNGTGGLTALPATRPSLTADTTRIYWAGLS